MKKDLHPTYHNDAKITCSCGAAFDAGSTREELSVETCSQCHPFYTGKQKIIDSTGRVDRFKKLREKSAAQKEERKDIKSKDAKKEERAEKNAEEKVAA